MKLLIGLFRISARSITATSWCTPGGKQSAVVALDAKTDAVVWQAKDVGSSGSLFVGHSSRDQGPAADCATAYDRRGPVARCVWAVRLRETARRSHCDCDGNRRGHSRIRRLPGRRKSRRIIPSKNCMKIS